MLCDVVDATVAAGIEVVVAAALLTATADDDFGMAVHLCPLIVVINCPAGRFALVDMVKKKCASSRYNEYKSTFKGYQ